MPSVEKASTSAEVPPWALREVDRLTRNPQMVANPCRRHVLEGHMMAKEALMGPPASLPYQERSGHQETPT